MYGAIRSFATFLKIGAAIWAMIGIVGFLAYLLDPRAFLGGFAPPGSLLGILLVGGVLLFHWLMLCLGMYAFGQFLDLQIAMGETLTEVARRRKKYKGYDEVPKDGNWASMPQRPGSPMRLLKTEEEDQGRNVWAGR
ncbi:MAG: hypothetical protein IT320_17140 [Anaerolineae bacterium]|nr:hypothetical protein [Anaerolineae bacterium]